MFQFNPDGSLKISNGAIQKKQENVERMKRGKCITVHKEMVNFTAPKKCVLRIRLSDNVTDSSFMERIHNYFKSQADTPTKIIKLNDKEFEIEVGTDFKRCSDCTNLISRYREFLDDNLIEEKGNCTYIGPRAQSFTYEDYFE
ncbi:MAG: hypothetical protein ACP5OA_03800 [Candidatus Woesearchaeota archaeon]